MGGADVTEITRRCVTKECACADGIRRLAMKPVVLARKHWVRMKIDPSHRRQKKSGGHIRTAAWKLSNPARAGTYEDLYLTEHPYGFVSGVATDLPDND
jgi:hypothetical protein